MSRLACRSCGAPISTVFADLGVMPVANALVDPHAGGDEPVYPLRAVVCEQCWLVQLAESPPPATHFNESYLYFSAVSQSWEAHARRFANDAIALLKLGPASHVVEVASNDGYLLQHFVEAGIPCLGIDPAAGCAQEAWDKRRVRTDVSFFGTDTAMRLRGEGHAADLMIANNVLAHVPDINDFVAGFAILLKPGGVATFEFPHLLELIRHTEFDTIYHEHYSYLSMLALVPLFHRHGLAIVDVERLPTHGGSLRIHVRHAAPGQAPIARVAAGLADETSAGLDRVETYRAFDDRVGALRDQLVAMLAALKQQGKRIACYGAPAKGNTLLNYCGIGADIIDFTVDRNPRKQNMLLPGTRIPVFAPEEIFSRRPDYVMILPWNIEREITGQLSGIAEWGGQFIVPVPVPRTFTP
jgi:SAM-dependent methyltransferase